MKKEKILCLIISLILIICAGGTVPVKAQSAGAGYMLRGSEENGEFVIHVALRNVRALGGRLAVAFDSEKLEMTDTSSIANAVRKTSDIVVTPEGLDASVLMSNEKGYVMFAWYTSGNSGIDAHSDDVEIASIPFKLKNGVTTEDFSRNTIGLYYVNETMAHKWNCSAQIVTDELMAYRNNDINDAYVCGIDYDYPNCDYIPPVTYEAGINVTDYSGNPIKASVMLDNLQSETENGYASFQMENGVYAYRVSADGYETKSGYIIIRDEDAVAAVQLMSHAQIAENTASGLAIVYENGDSAASVTANLVLPSQGEFGEEITWQSSNESIVTPQGIVIRGEDDVTVTLTAEVSLGNAKARRSFEINVKSRLSAEEKNMAVVSQDKSALDIKYAPGDSNGSVTSNLTLAEMGAYGSAIAWTSSNEDIVSNYGVVTRGESDTQVTLTALILRGTAQDTKEFTVTVKGERNQTAAADEETVNKVLSALIIGYSDGDSAQSVTDKLTLTADGADGTVIEWKSSHPAVVTAYGGVVRQAQDVSVTLTAMVMKGNVTKEKTFTVLVKAALQIPVNPDNGQESEIKQSNGSDAGGNGFTEAPTATQKPSGTNAVPTDVPQTERFNDIDSVPWAKEAILTLEEKGVISGTGDTTYSPQNPIRRADFITLLMRMLDLDGEINSTFDDVPKDKYYYETVSLAKSLGIISGVGDNKFNPEGSITRQDMMVMTYNALDKLGMADLKEADLSVFADSRSVADYAYKSVSCLVGAGYISGDSGNINPRNNTTRAETAVFLYQIYNNMQKRR